MVDVGPGAGDPPVVQQPHTFVGELVQALGESLLADGAALPGPGARRLVGQRQDQSADTGVRGADGGFPLRLPPPMFTPGRGAGDAIDKGTLRGPGPEVPGGQRQRRARTLKLGPERPAYRVRGRLGLQCWRKVCTSRAATDPRGLPGTRLSLWRG